VIDEADRLLDMGFIPSVKRIVRYSPFKEQRQTLMFSATFSYDVLNLARQWLFEPVTVEIEPEQKPIMMWSSEFMWLRNKININYCKKFCVMNQLIKL
jgi:superfamily II DNA/RNA helicase